MWHDVTWCMSCDTLTCHWHCSLTHWITLCHVSHKNALSTVSQILAVLVNFGWSECRLHNIRCCSYFCLCFGIVYRSYITSVTKAGAIKTCLCYGWLLIPLWSAHSAYQKSLRLNQPLLLPVHFLVAIRWLFSFSERTTGYGTTGHGWQKAVVCVWCGRHFDCTQTGVLLCLAFARIWLVRDFIEKIIWPVM